VPVEHRRVLQLLADCGTERLGRVSYRCAQCQQTHHTNASCGNRHCPGCQTANNAAWCAAQVENLLPCEYHLVTFTIPSELRRCVRSHQDVCYRALFDAAACALKTALGNPRFCGADTLGFTAVLHTFGRDLSYHPHVHVIIPAGGLVGADDVTGKAGSHRPDQCIRSAGGNRPCQWRPTRPGFLAPVKVLSQLFRAEFERLLRAQLPAEVLPPAAEFRREFVCDVQAVGNGVSTLKYLSRYVFRTAITNKRIVGIHNDQVTFTYRRGGESRDRKMALPVFEFLRRFLQHVLPHRLHKVRHYGFLSRRSAIEMDDVRAAIVQSQREFDSDVELQSLPVPWQRPSLARVADRDSGPTCPQCGGRLVFESFQRIRPPPLTECRSADPARRLPRAQPVPSFRR
jgi:hypothetical protein